MNFLSAAVPAERRRCLPGHVCLLPQVATGEGQLAVPMERRCGPNKRRREEENQLNLRWPPGNDTGASVSTGHAPLPSSPKMRQQKGWILPAAPSSSHNMGAHSGPSIGVGEGGWDGGRIKVRWGNNNGEIFQVYSFRISVKRLNK